MCSAGFSLRGHFCLRGTRRLKPPLDALVLALASARAGTARAQSPLVDAVKAG